MSPDRLIVMTVMAVLVIPLANVFAGGKTSGIAELGFASLRGDTEVATVKAVKSADTVVLDTGKQIKLIGLTAPDLPATRRKIRRNEFGFVVEPPSDPISSVEEQAIAFTRDLLEGKTVQIEYGERSNNEDFTDLAYVFIDDGQEDEAVLANSEILRQGYANLAIRPPNLKYADDLREAYLEARQEKRGLQSE